MGGVVEGTSAILQRGGGGVPHHIGAVNDHVIIIDAHEATI